MRCSPLRMVGLAVVLSACADSSGEEGDGYDGGYGDGTGSDDGGDDGGDGGNDGGDDGGSGDDGGGGTGDDGGGDGTGGEDGGTGGDDGGVDTPQGTCGTGGQKRQIVQIDMGSPERWYLIGAPDTDEPLPLVLAFHGDEGDPNNSTRWIWGNYWEQNNLPFIVVMTKCPGCESWYMGNTDANAQYVWDVLTDVSSSHNVDVSRVYAVGYSGGSEFLSMHGWEFQDVFAAIQWTCGGNAYYPYQAPPRPDCKVRGRIVISQDDFLWDGAQQLRQRLVDQGHEHEFVEAQCNGHCCDTPDHNSGAWAWFQQHTKCGGEVKGTCGELTDLPSEGGITKPIADVAIPPAPAPWPERVAIDDDDLAQLDALVVRLREVGDPQALDPERRAALFADAMRTYDRALANARASGPEAVARLEARYAEIRELVAPLAPGGTRATTP